MHLVTRINTKVDPDPENPGELTTISELDDCHVEERLDDVELMLKRVQAGDPRVKGVRIFELEVSDDGTPSIGAELT